MSRARAPVLGLIGLVGVLGGPPPAGAQEELLVPNNLGDSLTVHARTASGNANPLRILAGPATRLGGPFSIAVDAVHDELVVINNTNETLTVHARTASGNTAPLRTLAGPATVLSGPVGLAVDPVHDELVVANAFGQAVKVYARTASGNTAPLRTLAGPATGLNGPRGVAVDPVYDELVVANIANNSLTVYARTASGNAAPLRTLAGPATGLSGPVGVVVDPVHDELVVTGGGGVVRVYARTASGNTAPLRTLAGPAVGLVGPTFAALTTTPPLAAAMLPSSRSVQVGSAATAFVTIINAGPGPAAACAPTPITSIPATFFFQTTNAQNQPTGAPNTPANIPAGGAQGFVVAFTPTAAFGATDVTSGFACAGTNRAPVISGVNTLLLSASASPVPDVVAVAATLSGDGIVNVPGASGTGLFAVGTSNVGVTGTITVSADTGGVALPVTLTVCETNPATGACLPPGVPTPTVTVTYAGGTNRSFAIFARGSGFIPFDPALNRVSVRFKEGALTRGATSVAIRTQ